MEDEEQPTIWKASYSSSSSESNSMVSATVGRVITTLLTARPKKLQDAISRLHSPPTKGSIGVSLEQSLWFLHNYVREAAEKEDSMDQIFTPILEHSLRHKESKHGNQAMILLNWLFQDEHLFQAVATNLASIITRKDDHYIALGWCTLVRGLVDYENSMNQFKSDGMRKKYTALLKIFGSCIIHLLTIARNGSTLQGGFELPTRLSVAAADCILVLTVALAGTVVSDTSDNRSKTSKPSSSPSITLLSDTSKKVKSTSKGPNVSNLEMKKLLWDHLDNLTILVERLVAWSRKSWSLHAKGLERVLKWLQEIKGQYGCFQDEAGSRFLKTGVLLLSSCWKHYGMLMHLEDYKFSLHFKELLDQYLSGIQFYADNMEDHNENKESGIETIKFFLNCLSLLLGRLDGKKFESTMSEYRLQISRVLTSQLHCADEDVVDSAVWIFKTVIFKANNSSGGSNLYDTSQMDSVLPLLLRLLDEGVGTARAIIMLIAEFCSISKDGRCLQEVLKRLASGNVLQRRNAVDVISELISIPLDSMYFRQDVANCLLERLGDEELSIRAQVSDIIPMMDPALVLPTLVRLVYSSDEEIQSSASNTVIKVLKYHKQKFEVICILLDCLSNLCQNTNLPNASAEGGEAGSKLDTDIVLKLIPEWSKSVEDWNLLIEPLIDKMFTEPSNAIIVRFLSCISEHLADSADVLFHRVLLHTRGQEGFEDSFFSGWESRRYTGKDSVKLQHALFDRLCPLLVIRLLPLRVFNDLNSSIMYGELLEQHVLNDNGYFSIANADSVAGLLLNRAFNKLEFEDVRKLAAELCGRIDPQVLFPIISSQLENATSVQDALKIKACLFSMCTSLVVRGRDAISHPVMLKIKKAIETVLSWPSLDGDEVSKAQHGCIDFLALMICTELQGTQSFKDSKLEKISKGGKNSCSGDAATRNSVLTYVIDQLAHVGRKVVSSELSSQSCTPELSVPLSLSFRLCMANVLISASQKISDSVKKPFARKLLPHLIRSTGVVMESDIRAACVQVLFSAVYHLKASVVPYSSDLLSVSLKSLCEGSEKEKIAGAKLLASLMASEETVVESISEGLLEARSVLSSISLSHPSPELRQICEKLLMCIASP